jgi:uncharacterized protein YfaS (alpha-2-macroglobulin family)
MLAGLIAPLVVLAVSWEQPQVTQARRDAADKAFKAGNFKVAYDGYRGLVLDAKAEPRAVARDYRQAFICLQRLGRISEYDAFAEATVAAHPNAWRVLWEAAKTDMEVEHDGFIISGKFERGPHRGGGEYADASERDRARALQRMARAQSLMSRAPDGRGKDAGQFEFDLADMLVGTSIGRESWKFQELTDLRNLPDYDSGGRFHPWMRFGGNGEHRAPVGPDGNAVYYRRPASFDAATNDGERWRWALAQAAEVDPALTNTVRMRFANFLRGEFGAHTLAGSGLYGPGAAEKVEEGPYTVQTLADNETIANLATGIKRFTLPDEFNYLTILKQIADDPRTGSGQEALQTLAAEYEDRRQFDKAETTWKRCVAQYGPGQENANQARLDQIVRPWGRFEATSDHPAGKAPVLSYRFRNGTRVDFEAWAIDIDRLLNDVKAYLKNPPAQFDWQKFQVDNIGYRIVQENQNQYVKAPRVAAWGLDLKAPPKHEDARVDVKTPLDKPGAYLVTAKMANGNVGRVIVWVADTALVKKPLEGRPLLYVADAVTGVPVSQADLDFFGFRTIQQPNGRPRIETKEARATTDADGMATPEVGRPDQFGHYQYLITARTKQGRLAYLGWTGVWSVGNPNETYDQVHVFVMTDRPVYRPKQTVHIKAWVGRSKYDVAEASEFAGRTFTLEVHDPKGEKVLTKALAADKFGGIETDLDLSSEAALGQYGVHVVNHGGGMFRVEEYKKPEFEVDVEAPSAPVSLGEKVEAKITARYLFGSPVTQAKVHYKVLRTPAESRWYPARRWDWLYGPGYAWFGQDRTWYPGFRTWGWLAPMPIWWGHPVQQPEVVAEGDAPIGADGTLVVPIDTALAKAVHGDQDHRYQITAEVTDQSRRTIVGQGTVIAARQPFRVVVWLARGYLTSGETVEVGASVRTPDNRPVAGSGKLTLLKITYDEAGKPTEKPVESWPVTADDEGMIAQKLVVADAGQYRVSLNFTDEKGHVQEGGYLFSALGPSATASSYRYNDLELIPDKAEYRPGDRVRLMINVNKPGATVLLFARPRLGAYAAPKVIRMDGRSQVEEIVVQPGDMPNFFVEAVTVADARVHTEARQIVVPPEKRVADVDIVPESTEYLPGGKAKVALQLTGADGKPFLGSTVLTAYDKAVEYISGGTNVPDIRSTFWQWKRAHYPQTESNLGRHSDNLIRPREVPMMDLGAFGGLITEGFMKDGRMMTRLRRAAPARMLGGYGGAGGMAPAAPAAMAAPMESAAAGGEALRSEMAVLSADEAPSPGAAPVEPTVRSNFADTAFWAGSITTDDQGKATVEFDLPESLTTWKLRAWSIGPGTRVGQGESQVITRKNIIVRLQAPRFFVQKDEVVLSANVHNELKAEKAVRVLLELGDSRLQGLDAPERTVTIAAGDEARVDWRVKVVEEGETTIRMKALTDEESDAVEMKFPVYVHGMLKTESYSTVIRPDETSATLTVKVPEERRPEATRLDIRYSPTLAGAMVDALPYLADYPYGCTEQTLNRFLPTVIAEKVLLDMGLDLSAIRAKVTNLNAQELGDPADRAKKWGRPDKNPIWDESEVREMSRAGLERLVNMQCSDGGWGWFSGLGEHSWPHTTAVVVHGLQVAKAIDLTLPEGVLEKGTAWLQRYQFEQIKLIQKAPTKKAPYKEKADDLDAYVFMVLTDAGLKSPEMLAFLDRDRVGLSLQGKAMFGMALQKLGEKDKLALVIENIEQFLVVDDENQTAHLRLPETGWWYWYNSENEVHAYYLKLLSRTDPKGPIASKLVKYLINNRRNATYWTSTRDSALCIEALADYLKASGEDRPDQTIAVLVDGQEKARVKVDASTLFSFQNTVTLAGEALAAGEHKVELRKEGQGPLYANAYLTNFTLEDPITRAGLEIKVDRKVYKLIPEDKTKTVAGDRGRVVAQKVEKYRREELPSGALLKSGELVEVELLIDSKNDYEYLIFEDMKAAGFEPVDVRSGYTGNALGAYVEFHDERVAFFARTLARGQHSVAYRLRAEIPGFFSALPTKAHAMYAPELRANSDEIKLKIED